MSIEKILIVEDNQVYAKDLAELLRQSRYDVALAPRLAAAREFLARDTFDLLLLDLTLPDGNGVELLKELQTRPQQPVTVIMTANPTVQSVVECMRHGAFDYLPKPFGMDEFEITIEKATTFHKLVKVNQYLSHKEDEDSSFELLGKSPAIEQLRQLIRKVARTDATVLIQGESGTGKELIARELYRQSSRASAPFIRVNCAAIPENLIESEFFGHEKGSFTGAINKREGRFELAHGGTILLDEISEISPQVQAKLLRVLQERELERVGGTRTVKVDVRVIATTNRKLEESVARKEFREDLYFRLNVVPILVAPLRERREDVPMLAEHFTQKFSRQHGVKVRGISPECMTAMREHSWPGNVRELQNVIERAAILARNGRIRIDLPDLAPADRNGRRTPAAAGASAILTEDDRRERDRRNIVNALEACGGKVFGRGGAAELLDVKPTTLASRIKSLGIRYQRTRKPVADEAQL
jgi:DNA-binding NtrC family response regulator